MFTLSSVISPRSKETYKRGIVGAEASWEALRATFYEDRKNAVYALLDAKFV